MPEEDAALLNALLAREAAVRDGSCTSNTLEDIQLPELKKSAEKCRNRRIVLLDSLPKANIHYYERFRSMERLKEHVAASATPITSPPARSVSPLVSMSTEYSLDPPLRELAKTGSRGHGSLSLWASLGVGWPHLLATRGPKHVDPWMEASGALKPI